jgi:vitamin B12 transporter
MNLVLVMKKDLRIVGLWLCLSASISGGFAQEVSLDPVTVTSTLLEKRASETGRNIAVIKGDYFQSLPVHSIDDLLRYVPGLEIQARGPMGAQSDIVLRGGTFQQVLVILDGVRINDPNTGHFNSYIPIAPSEIERIEVLKGASSAMYGSEAVGGVVAVI